jgi:hypothetical protein
MTKNNEKMDFVIEDSKAGAKTLKVQKNKTEWYIHSSYDPCEQAQHFAELNYSNDDEILLYGLGLGYHIKALLELMDSRQKLFVIETSKRIHDLFLQFGASEIIADERLVIMIPESIDEIETFLNNSDWSRKILYYTPSVKLIENKFEFLKTWLNNYRLDMNSSISFKKMHENHHINTNLNCKNFLQLFENRCSNIPCLIVASGPSLSNVKDFIKKAKGNCIIISVGRNNKFFKELEVEPTIFIEIDSHDIVAERFEENSFECPLVFLSTVSSKLPAVYRGPKSIIYVRSSISDRFVVEGGGSTVAAIAIEVAVKMGCSPIGLIAQDLVFDNGKSHYQSEEIHINPDLMQMVLCNDGEMRYTNKSFIRHKTSIESVISRAPQSSIVYSLTKKGICINNAGYIAPEVFLSKYSIKVTALECEIRSEI